MTSRAIAGAFAVLVGIGFCNAGPSAANEASSARLDGSAVSTAVISGRVTCDRAPEPGAHVVRPLVTIATSRNRVLEAVTADDDGRFAVPIVFDGKYTVVARWPGCGDATLARVPRGSAVAFALSGMFVVSRDGPGRSASGAFQPTEPILTYRVCGRLAGGFGPLDVVAPH